MEHQAASGGPNVVFLARTPFKVPSPGLSLVCRQPLSRRSAGAIQGSASSLIDLAREYGLSSVWGFSEPCMARRQKIYNKASAASQIEPTCAMCSAGP